MDHAERNGSGRLFADPGTVLVSGGAGGLGAAVVAAVRDAGGRPLVLDRLPAPHAVAHEIVDLADSRAAEAAARRLIERGGGRLDAVFTAAGTDTPAPFGSLPGTDWDRIVAVNLLGTAAVLRAALPALEVSGGCVVTCASTLGLRVAGDASAYCASKFGVVGLTRALAEELKGRVGVTLLVPGGMTTGFFDDREDRYKPPPDAKLNRPQDVARAVLFAITQPAGCELKELVVTSRWETSYP
ncbi:SDR family oxidoreductase [Frankia sp. EI5c]|uniref:SDR family oxidoreductase n=1 Tax=Frankia sp. EI5c TaxID=683316 RepID=UPI0037BE8E5D